MEIKFIHDEPCLSIGKALVVADLHLGIETKYKRNGIELPSNTNASKEKILHIAEEFSLDSVIFLGDVKEGVPSSSFQEKREIPEFFSAISDALDVMIVKGNHDAGIENLVKDAEISDFAKIGNFYLAHGHKWPKEDFLGAKALIIGHEHPMIQFKDKLGYRFSERAWVRGNINKSKLSEKYGDAKISIERMIIMPAFNKFSGGLPLNGDYERIKRDDGSVGLGPLARCMDIRNAEICLLDGTQLGKLKHLETA